MDSSLVEILNTTSLATYQPFFFWSWFTMYNYPTLSKRIHYLVSLTCTKYNAQNIGLVVFRTNDLVLCKKYVTKILWLKKLCTSWMLWKTEYKVLVWHKILVKRLLFCLCKIWVCKFGDLINRLGLEGGTCFKFFCVPKFSLCWVTYAFCLEQYWTKISLFIPRLNA